MKQTILYFSLIAAIGVALTCCNRNPDPEPDPEKFTADVSGTFIGNENGKGVFNLTVDVISQDNDDNHFKIALTLLSDAIADDDILDARLTTQKYTISASGELYTIKTDAYIMKDSTEVPLRESEIDISVSENTHAMKFDIIDNNGNEYKLEYTGDIDFEPQYEAIYDNQNGWYWGDDVWRYPGIAQYMSLFHVGELRDYSIYDGHYIGLSFYDDMAPKAWEAQVPNKTYTASEEYQTGTFLIAPEEIRTNERWRIYAYAYYESGTAGDTNKQFVIGGTIKVLQKGEDQEVRFNLLLEDGTRHIGKYTGYIKQGDEFTVTSLREDVEIGELNFGYLEYQGPSPMAGKDNNRWNLRIYNNGITVDPDYYWSISGTGEFVRIAIYTEQSVTTDIPAGEYNIGDETAGNAGLGEGIAGLDWGTWYFKINNTEDVASAPARTGKIIIGKTGETYTIDIDVVDDRENHITGSYSGMLEFYDSHRSTPAPPLRLQKTNIQGYKPYIINKNMKTEGYRKNNSRQ